MTVRPPPGPDRDPVPMADALGEIARRLDMAPAVTLAAVFGRWDEVVGPIVSAHCRPVGLRRGVLDVEVDEPGWATQLRHLDADLKRRLETHLGAGEVREIRLRVRRVPA